MHGPFGLGEGPPCVRQHRQGPTNKTSREKNDGYADNQRNQPKEIVLEPTFRLQRLVPASTELIKMELGDFESRYPALELESNVPSCSIKQQQRNNAQRTGDSSADLEQLQVLEISPGVKVRVRGANETWDCIRKDFYLPTICLDCNLDLGCIQDAAYVLCPRCRVVSPLEGLVEGYDGRVGIGFTLDDLHRWQHDILTLRQARSCSSSGISIMDAALVFRS